MFDVHIDVNAIEQTAVFDDRQESDPEGHFFDQIVDPDMRDRSGNYVLTD